MSSNTADRAPPAPIEQIDVHEAARRQRAGAVLVDVREHAECASGLPLDALAIPMAGLVDGLAAAGIPASREILLLCAAGARSARAGAELHARGFARVASVRGGFFAWRAAGLPECLPGDGGGAGTADRDFSERYLRHLLLPEVGEAGQRRLEAARVLLVGAGGLGSPSALYLAAAGVGTLGLVDDDRVERSNLQRQVLHTEASIGTAKVESAARTLRALNPRVDVQAIAVRLDRHNVEEVLAGYDVIVDGADNFPTRYLLSDACVRLGKPLVYGAVHRFEGQVSVFDAGRARGVAPCYRCLFPQPPPAESAPNCAEAGVLGVVPGVIGMLQAAEVIKLLLGLGRPLTGRLLHVDTLSMRFRETRLGPDPECAVCAPGRPFPGYIDYQRFCAA